MKVRILSGNNAGQCAEMDGSELEFNVSTGFVERVDEGSLDPVQRVEAPSAPSDVEADQQAETAAAAAHTTSDQGE